VKEKFIFIINSVQNQRCIKRIDEFIDNNYCIKAYGFSRDTTTHTKAERFDIEILDKFSNSKGYFSRLLLFFRDINGVLKTYRHESVIFYYFGLDIAMVGSFLSRKSYMYEESDLSHTYISNPMIRWLLERIDRYIIKKSKRTILTSEGFYKYHFGDSYRKNNVVIIPNRLNRKILSLNYAGRKIPNINKLKIAFVGGARFDSVLNFASVFAENFPNHEFHFYGDPMTDIDKYHKLRDDYSNVFFHGAFKNPDGLPSIYENIDLVLSTYDVKYDNVKYAEPNKIYEAIYFEVPIIVSKGTYLAEKVESLNIGFAIDPLNDHEIISFIDSLTLQIIEEKSMSCARVSKDKLVNVNKTFFKELSK